MMQRLICSSTPWGLLLITAEPLDPCISVNKRTTEASITLIVLETED